MFGQHRNTTNNRPVPATVPSGGLPTVGYDETSVPELLTATADMVRRVNAVSGHLPPHAVVLARLVLDAITETLGAAQRHTLDINTRITLHSTVTDYLPTTITTYLTAARGGVEDPDSLVNQLEQLNGAVSKLIVATRDQDATAARVQALFLDSKFGTPEVTL